MQSARWRLIHKGMLLIAFPLCCSLIFLGWLFGVIRESQNEAARELQAARILSAAESFMVGDILLDLSCVTYVAEKHEESLEDHKEAKSEMVRALRELNELRPALKEVDKSARQEDFDGLYRNVVAWTQNTFRKQASLIGMSSSLSLSSVTGTEDPKIGMKFYGMGGMDQLDRLIAGVRTTDENATRQRRLLWERIKVAIYGGLAGCAVICGAMAIWFNREITGRLLNVRRNIESMNNHQDLLPPVGGSDEVAVLDAAVHDTALQLRELQEYRARMTTLIGKQLGGPLEHIREVLQKLVQLREVNEIGVQHISNSLVLLDRLLRMTHELLGLDKVQATRLDMTFAPVNASSLLQNAAQSVAVVAREKKIAIQVDCQDCEFDADPDKVCQLLVNLLSNAVKFSPEGSTVMLRARREAESIRMEVADQGRGIPKEFQEKLFTRYSQVQSSDGDNFKGFGLGLSICKLIAEGHGGSIGVESEAGKGTTFLVQVPLRQEAPPAVPVEKRTAEYRTANDPPRSLFGSFKVDMPLWQKGILILVPPLLFQVAVIGTLGSLLNDANARMERVAQLRYTSAEGTKIMHTGMRMTCAAVYYRIFGTKELQQVYEDKRREIEAELHTFQQRLNEKEGPVVDATVKLVNEGKNAADGIIREAGNGLPSDQVFADASAAQHLEETARNLRDALKNVRQREAELDSELVQFNKKVDERVVWLLTLAVVVNVFFAGAAAVIAAASISSRVNSVLRNAKNLLARRTLAEPERGTDEISQIDQTFYTTAREVLELEQFKQQLISVVSHDLRTPLTAVQGVLELSSLGMFGELPAVYDDEIAQGESEFKELMELINRLLTTQKAQELAEVH